ncbi:hypothetical protein L0F63_004949, partial [Massospora cicadina]
ITCTAGCIASGQRTYSRSGNSPYTDCSDSNGRTYTHTGSLADCSGSQSYECYSAKFCVLSICNFFALSFSLCRAGINYIVRCSGKRKSNADVSANFEKTCRPGRITNIV